MIAAHSLIPRPRSLAVLAVLLLAAGTAAAPAKAAARKPAKKGTSSNEPSPLDLYIQEAMRNAPAATGAVAAPGSTWTPASRLLDMASDVRARLVDDMVTVLVAESVSAGVTGVTKTARSSAAKSSIPAL